MCTTVKLVLFYNELLYSFFDSYSRLIVSFVLKDTSIYYVAIICMTSIFANYMTLPYILIRMILVLPQICFLVKNTIIIYWSNCFHLFGLVSLIKPFIAMDFTINLRKSILSHFTIIISVLLHILYV
jgi:hypothetical protein